MKKAVNQGPADSDDIPLVLTTRVATIRSRGLDGCNYQVPGALKVAPSSKLSGPWGHLPAIAHWAEKLCERLHSPQIAVYEK